MFCAWSLDSGLRYAWSFAGLELDGGRRIVPGLPFDRDGSYPISGSQTYLASLGDNAPATFTPTGCSVKAIKDLDPGGTLGFDQSISAIGQSHPGVAARLFDFQPMFWAPFNPSITQGSPDNIILTQVGIASMYLASHDFGVGFNWRASPSLSCPQDRHGK